MFKNLRTSVYGLALAEDNLRETGSYLSVIVKTRKASDFFKGQSFQFFICPVGRQLSRADRLK